MSEDEVIIDNKFNRSVKNVRQTQQNMRAIKPDQTQQPAPQEAAQSRPRRQAPITDRTLYSIPIARTATRTPEERERTMLTDEIIPEIFNFRFAMRQLKLEVRRAEKYDRPLSILIIGFHELKVIKAQVGEHALETCMRAAGADIPKFVEMGIDVVGRYAPDKFIMVLPEQPGASATMTAEEIRKHFTEHPVEYRHYKFNLKASIGISCYPQHGNDWKALIAKADLATDMLYEKGGNAFKFSPS